MGPPNLHIVTSCLIELFIIFHIIDTHLHAHKPTVLSCVKSMLTIILCSVPIKIKQTHIKHEKPMQKRISCT